MENKELSLAQRIFEEAFFKSDTKDVAELEQIWLTCLNKLEKLFVLPLGISEEDDHLHDLFQAAYFQYELYRNET